jgi:hypothetical protein
MASNLGAARNLGRPTHMNVPDPSLMNAEQINGGGRDVLDGHILELVCDPQPISPDERRRRERFPICCKLQLTPIVSATPLLDETSIIVGKDLSVSGICFSHEFPLSHRRMMLSLSHPEVGQFIVEAEVAWTRLTAVGLYETGCRLIRKIAGHKINLME